LATIEGRLGKSAKRRAQNGVGRRITQTYPERERPKTGQLKKARSQEEWLSEDEEGIGDGKERKK